MHKLVDPDLALRLVVDATSELAPRPTALARALGLVLAAPVRADRDYPPFDRAAMDGVAVKVDDAGKQVRVRGEAAAGHEATGAVEPGVAVEVMTGAPCPPGTEAVVPREDLTANVQGFVLPAHVKPYQHVAGRGSECAAGAAVLAPGDVVTTIGVAVLASFGVAEASVIPRPRVAVVVTGDEIVPPGKPVGPGQIRDSNGAMLSAMVAEADAELTSLRFAGDSPGALREALRGPPDADVLLLTGGVSAGKYDLVPAALVEAGFELVFHKVQQKPGKPLLFGHRVGQLVFGLPGNPLSVHLGFARYVLAALAKMRRRALPGPQRGELTAPLNVRGERTSFVLAQARRNGAALEISPLVGRGSADVFASARARVYLRLDPGAHALPAGAPVEVTWAGAPVY